jgi:polyisoprenoid-binding protein YceI
VDSGRLEHTEYGPQLAVSGSAATRINRKDFGLNWNRALETGGVAVSEEVDISLELALVGDTRAPAAAKGTR